MIDGGERRTIELNPKSATDPFAKASAFVRQKTGSATTSTAGNASEDDAGGFCDQLFEVPALKEAKVAQIATGGRSSYVRTSAGKVLGWGANEYGLVQ